MSSTQRQNAFFVGAVAAAVAVLAPMSSIVPAQGLSTGVSQAPQATERIRGRDAAAREVLVGLRPAADLARLRADADADSDTPVGSGRLWRVRSRTRNVASLMALLSARGDVAFVEPNYIVHAVREPDDPRFPELWGLQNLGQIVGGIAGVPGADIGAPAAWDKAIGSRNAVVGIVDTGVDYTHSDLAANVWSAPAAFTVTIAGRTITCAAGTHGFHAINKTCDPFDDNTHGSHVAGTIGASGNNHTGVVGVNWIASVMGLKFLSSSGSGTLSDAINAIEFAIQAKARFGQGANVRVLSNSWSGGGFSQALLDEIVKAGQNEMLFVAAAGNSASDNDAVPAYPSSYAVPNVIAVAATNNQDGLASFSNFGATSVHLGAPGVQVLSTVIGGGYQSFSGTSMATPHVSGAAALLLSRCTADTASLKAMILNSVDPIAALAGRTTTGGRLNVARAIASCGRAGNVAPAITLTAPADGAVLSTPGPTLLTAGATDADGSVAQVAFYAGTALIGVDAAPPFQFSWTDPAVGNYVITAVATDNEGATTTSPGVAVRILPSTPPFGGSPAVIPGVIEAENFNEGGEGFGYHDLTPGNASGQYRQTDVDIQSTADVGGGYSLGYVETSEWLAYSVSAVASGSYTIESRIASAGAGGFFHVELDGSDVTGSMMVPDTGGWQTWQSIVSAPVSIAAGSHLLRVVMDAKGSTGWVGNFNYFRLSAPGINRSPVVQLTSPANGASFTAPATIALAATASDPDGSVAQVAFYAGTTLIGSDSTPPYTFTYNNVPAGTYNLTAVATDNAGASTTSTAIGVVVVNPPNPTPFGGQPATIPGTIEAENFDDGGEGIAYHDLTAGNTGGKYRQTGVDIENTADTGGGYSLGYVSAGEWLKYTVSVVATGTYALEIRAASPGAGGLLHVEVDGVDATGALAVPNTGGWQIWRSMMLDGIPLTAGAHVLRLVADANGSTGYVGNLNLMRWTPSGSGNLPPTVQITVPADGSVVPPGTITLTATASDPDGTIAQVAFYAGATLLGVDTAGPFTLAWTGVTVGDYTLTARAVDNAGVSATSVVTVHVAGAPVSAPFGGVRAAVPGTIELENFDEGGEGLAYHDTTAGNSGRQYRQTDVDVEFTSDTVGGGYSIGYVTAGEWLVYSVQVAATGSYALQARVASTAGNASFHLEVDGADVTGPMAVPNTGGWQVWQTVTRPGVPLSAGPHLMRIVFDSAAPSTGFVGNFNWVSWQRE